MAGRIALDEQHAEMPSDLRRGRHRRRTAREIGWQTRR